MTKLADDILAAPDHKARAFLKAHAHKDALEKRWPKTGPMTLNRDGLTVIVDSHGLVLDPDGNTVGFDVMVRAFRAGTEVKIDPHRRFTNPPTMHGGIEDLDAVFEEMIFSSIADEPNPHGFRP